MDLILGLDMATHNSGIAVLDMNMKLVNHLNIIAPNGDITERCAFIYDQLENIIIRYPSIKYAALEDTLLNKFVPNLNSCRDLITLKGWTLALLHKYNIDVTIWSAVEWKSWVGILNGDGGKTRAAQKLRSINLVKNKFDIDVDDNQSDSICLSIANLMHLTNNHDILNN